jgi:hypothetical protein
MDLSRRQLTPKRDSRLLGKALNPHPPGFALNSLSLVDLHIFSAIIKSE